MYNMSRIFQKSDIKDLTDLKDFIIYNLIYRRKYKIWYLYINQHIFEM